MSSEILVTLVNTQSSINRVMDEMIKAVSPCSEEGKRISQNELMRIKVYLMNAKEKFDVLENMLYKSNIIKEYNDSIISEIENCSICELVDEKAKISDIVKNPMFQISVFSIKNLLEVIDDKIAEQDHQGIKGCLTSIAVELSNFKELHEVSQALYDVRDTFTDIVMVSDMMFDFEKFYSSVFILHDDLNVGIALGSIKSVLPAPEMGDIEFF